MKQPILLRIFRENQLEGVKQFTDPQIIMGRHGDVQLELNDESVSPLHALIEERETGYYISDLGSQSGTFVSGHKIVEQKIESGQEFQVGSYRIQFFIGVPKPTKPPSPDVAQPETSASSAAISSSQTSSPPVTPPKKPPLPSSSKPVGSSLPPAAKPPLSSSSKPVGSSPPAAKLPLPSSSKPVGSSPPAAKSSRQPPSSSKPVGSSLPPAAKSSRQPPSSSKPVGSSLPPAAKPSWQLPSSSTGPFSSSASKTSQVSKAVSFASPSLGREGRSGQSVSPIIRPDRGTVVEVLVAWRERVISSHHFNGKRTVTVGTNEKCDIIVPFLGSGKKRHQLLRIDSLATICVDQNISGDYIRDDLSKVSFADLVRKGRFSQTSNGYELQIAQGDMVRMGLHGDLISIYIRYVPETPKPLMAPILDLTSAEVTGVVLALVVSAVIGLYMMIYSPSTIIDDEKADELMRRAVVTFTPPKKIIRETIKKVTKVPTEKGERTTPPKPAKKEKAKSGRAAEVKPNRNKTRKKKKLTSARSGGAKKTGKKGSGAKSQKVDPSQTGLLGVFGSKGTQKTLDQVYSGTGELQGVADTATGFSGQAEDRAGDDMGVRTKNTGAGGRGKSTVGISGVGTKGKGTGDFGQGQGGLNKKGRVVINMGGQEAEFVGSLDREAIRRVIRNNIKAIKNCYDRELNKNKNLYGKLVLRWNIIEQGRVTKAKVVSNSLGSPIVAKCIMTRLKTWRFPEPPPNTEGEVTYPFVFSSQ